MTSASSKWCIILAYKYTICSIYCQDRIFYVHDVYYTCMQYMHLFACICTYTDCISVRIRAFTYGHCAVTVALRSPAPALVSTLSLSSHYGKVVVRQHKHSQFAKFNQSRSARQTWYLHTPFSPAKLQNFPRDLFRIDWYLRPDIWFLVGPTVRTYTTDVPTFKMFFYSGLEPWPRVYLPPKNG